MEVNVNSAIKKGFFQQVRFQLEFGASPNCRDEERRTPLMNCALVEEESWGEGLSRTLLEKGANMILRDGKGMNALHYACIYGRQKLVSVLLRSADFDLIQQDQQGNTPLHYAAMKGIPIIIQSIIDAMRKYKLSLDKPNKLGYTALMQAWRSGNEETAKVLLRRGADVLPRDLVEQKTAEDYEEEYYQWKKDMEERQSLKRSRPGFFYNLPVYRRPMSAVSQSSTQSRRDLLKSRPVSASSSLLPQRKGRRWEQQQHEEITEEDYIDNVKKDRTAGRLIHSASRSNPRNRPELLLNVTPREYFRETGNFRSPHHLSITSIYSDTERGSAPCKSEVRKMYNAFHFQFTSSYRKPAHPRVEAVQERSVSPNPSDMDTSEKGKRGRKGSTRSNLSNEEKGLDKKGRKTSAGARGLSRKSSSVSINSLKSQQTLMDCSSNESVNSTMKSVRSIDLTEKPEKNPKIRSRKISSALDDPQYGAEQAPKTPASRVVPAVKEPGNQDQLRAIRE